ncbi:MAG: sugar transferase [Bacteroidota bacterium]|nr:sugar transferase [Bacteroidota bacterium]
MDASQILAEGRKISIVTPSWKRAFDVIFAVLLLIIFLPAFLLIIVAQQYESRGSVFYISKRVGAGYSIFSLIKFRSMYANADDTFLDLAKSNNHYNKSGNQQSVFIKIKNDPRITVVGKFIRRTSLDELPQLINVLRGDMSIVGNRPIPINEAQKLIEENNFERFYAPGGITGLWQVTKQQKESFSDTDRIILDNSYVNKMTPLTDLRIIAKTVFVVLAAANV